jgi:hypothetical protein
VISETTNKLTNRSNRIFAIRAASPATPPNPSAPTMVGRDWLKRKAFQAPVQHEEIGTFVGRHDAWNAVGLKRCS